MSVALLIAVCVCAKVQISAGQSNVVLRDLTRISERTIESFSQESVRLSDGSELGWDEVLRGTVEGSMQAEFDRNIREIGLPLFRLKQRIAVGDWTRLNEVAENLLIRYSGINSATAKTVCLAAAKGKLESGKRAEAVLPFLMACVKEPNLPDSEIQTLGFAADEFEAGVASQLIPVWFDLDLVRKQKELLAAYATEVGKDLPPGGKVYLASFCLALGEFEQAKEYADQVEDTGETLQQWKRFLLSEVDRQTRMDANRMNLFQVDDKTLPDLQAAAAYFEAVALDNAKPDTEPVSQILAYLKVSAIWGEQFPNLSSAAIYRAIALAEAANMNEEAKSMTAELLRRFAKSYHGKMLALKNSSRR